MPEYFSRFLLKTLSAVLAVFFCWGGLQLFSQALPSQSLAKSDLVNSSGLYKGVTFVAPEKIQILFPKSNNKPKFIEFKTRFCAACKKMKPTIEALKPQYPDIDFYIIDIMQGQAQYKPVIEAFNPSVVPIIILANHNGEVINVLYDEQSPESLRLGLDCLNPKADGKACELLAKASQVQSTDWLSQAEAAFNNSVNGGSLLAIGFAFLAGVVTALLPCTLAMLPVLVGYMGGYSGGSKWQITQQACLFILGLATVMTALGVTLSLLGFSFGSQSNAYTYWGLGLVCIVMGAQMLGVFKLPLPQLLKGLPETQQGKLISFYVLGCAFGAVASPCGTPILATMLAIIAREGNIVLGAASLFAYALGQGSLLLVAGLFTGLLKYKTHLLRWGDRLTQTSGLVLVAVGVFFVLQALGVVQL